MLLLLGASEASEQSERAKLSGAFSGFPLLTHAFVGAPLLSLAFCCFASLHVVWHFLLNGTLAFNHSCSILFLVAPCLVLFSLVLPCANNFLKKIALPVHLLRQVFFFGRSENIFFCFFEHRFWISFFIVFERVLERVLGRACLVALSCCAGPAVYSACDVIVRV